MGSDIVTGFKVTLIIMLFYSFCVSVIVEFIPADARPYVTSFSDASINLDDFSQYNKDVQNQLTQQTNIPVIDVGALVFYSGNILLNLLINFVYAIPEMVGFLIYGMTQLFNLNGVLVIYIQMFATVTMTVMYLIGLVQLITGIRSGQLI